MAEVIHKVPSKYLIVDSGSKASLYTYIYSPPYFLKNLEHVYCILSQCFKKPIPEMGLTDLVNTNLHILLLLTKKLDKGAPAKNY